MTPLFLLLTSLRSKARTAAAAVALGFASAAAAQTSANVVVSGTSGTNGAVTVTSEYVPPSNPAYFQQNQFTAIPNLSAGAPATISVVSLGNSAGNQPSAGGPLSVLTDGLAPASEAELSTTSVFAASGHYGLLLDLGAVRNVTTITTYNAEPAGLGRGQNWQVWGAETLRTIVDGQDPYATGWTRIAIGSSGAAFGALAAQGGAVGIHLSRPGGTPIGSFRYILFGMQTSTTPGDEAMYGGGQSRLSEISIGVPAIEGPFDYQVRNGVATITRYRGSGGDLVIPATLGGFPVVAIGEAAFYWSYALRSVVIPAGIASVGRQAFAFCSYLESVVLPSSLRSIGDQAFYGCGTLRRLTMPDGVVSIGAQAFASCFNLVEVSLPASLETLGTSAFRDCASLQTLTLPPRLTAVAEAAFAYCTGLRSVVMHDAVEVIGPEAFRACANLGSVRLSSTLRRVEAYAFMRCPRLKSVVFPASLEYLGDHAFGTNSHSSGDGAWTEDAKDLEVVCFLGNAPSLGTEVFGVPGAVKDYDWGFPITGRGQREGIDVPVETKDGDWGYPDPFMTPELAQPLRFYVRPGATGFDAPTWPTFPLEVTESQVLVVPGSIETVAGNPIELRAYLLALVPAGEVPVFRWLRNESLLDGQTSSVLSLTHTAPSDAGVYRAEVTSTLGVFASQSSATVVLEPLKAQFWVNSPRGTAGRSVSLNAWAEGDGPFTFQWLRDGVDIPGATDAWLEFGRIAREEAGAYSVRITNPYGTRVSSEQVVTVEEWGQVYHSLMPPSALTGLGDVVALDSGVGYTLFLRRNGTVTVVGDAAPVKTDLPANLTDVVAISAGLYHALALRADGTVVGWGFNQYGEATPPVGLDHVVAISAGISHSLALRDDGSVVGWGSNVYGESTIPPDLGPVKAVSAGAYFSVALRQDGTVVAWGSNIWGELQVPAGLSGVKAISAGAGYTLALKEDGTVVAWGLNWAGQTNVPAGLGNVVALCSKTHCPSVLRADGTLVGWGSLYGGNSESDLSRVLPANLPAVSSFSMGYNSFEGIFVTAVLADSVPPRILEQPSAQTVVAANPTTLEVFASGRELTYQWLRDGVEIAGATGTRLSFPRVKLADAGVYTVRVSNGSGFVLSAPATLTVRPWNMMDQTQFVSGLLDTVVVLRAPSDDDGPLRFQWFRDGVAVPGAQGGTLAIARMTAADAATYSAVISHAFGTRTSVFSVVLATEPLSPSTLSSVGSARLLGDGSLQLTATGGQTGAAWLNGGIATNRSFSVRFRFSLTALADGPMADGIAFALHNRPQPSLGVGGSQLGFTSLGAVGSIVQTYTRNRAGLNVNGISDFTAPAPANLGLARVVTGEQIVAYDAVNKVLGLTGVLVVDGVTYHLSENVQVNLAAKFGATVTAGFTGATGLATADQRITAFKLEPTDAPTVRLEAAAGGVAVLWPLTASDWTLETTTDLGDPGSWTIVPNGALPSGASYRIVEPLVGPARFYRLRR